MDDSVFPEIFYKYASPQAALAILRNRSLQWSAPELFNDPFDVQFDMHVEPFEEQLIDTCVDLMIDIYLGKEAPSLRNPMGWTLDVLRKTLGTIPLQDFRSRIRPVVAEQYEKFESTLEKTHVELREYMKGWRVLCLSKVPDDILMWSHYAQNHSGVVLGFKYIEELDGVWAAAHPVRYESKMPRLATPVEQIRFLAGCADLDVKDVFFRSILTKASNWSYEQEWRIFDVAFSGSGLEYRQFNENELSSVILGCRASPSLVNEILELVAANYGNASIIQASKSKREFMLELKFVESKV